MSLDEKKKRYHVNLSRYDLKGVTTALLPGDPQRVEYLANLLDKNFDFITTHREYTSATALINNQKVLICSTGMGGPSVGICLEELAMLGVKNFIRVGTTGAIQKHINLGDVIITSASVRLDGTSLHYAPIEYPAVADFDLTMKLVESARIQNIAMHLGITASSDTFYPGQERYDSYSGYVRRSFQGSLKEWQKLNVLNYEMESSALFSIASTFGLKAASIAAVIANRVVSETPDATSYDEAMAKIINIVKKLFD
ncbi:uridine phosphorylase [Thiotrichales bacterium 19S3-7]|nr:uridine phosphorylase [Thiotrichales bacterium 19S3-7]MCF6802282.1 uridine phosphorylase [Thiotrichales bacterium 19S3-11]